MLQTIGYKRSREELCSDNFTLMKIFKLLGDRKAAKGAGCSPVELQEDEGGGGLAPGDLRDGEGELAGREREGHPIPEAAPA